MVEGAERLNSLRFVLKGFSKDGRDLTDKETKAFLAAADKDGDGKIGIDVTKAATIKHERRRRDRSQNQGRLAARQPEKRRPEERRGEQSEGEGRPKGQKINKSKGQRGRRRDGESRTIGEFEAIVHE
ncbi:hypothetical protein NFI96_007359 [Prochilodus magdalenae]|nr:hypothetical protein NFI96_007359 [Prochilodus magdalenae]